MVKVKPGGAADKRMEKRYGVVPGSRADRRMEQTGKPPAKGRK